jgi:hypothetical protein
MCKWLYHIVEYIPLDTKWYHWIIWSGITGSYGSSHFSFLRHLIVLSIVVTLIYIPTNSVKVFLPPTSLPAFVVVCVIDGSHFDWGEVLSPCSLICISIMTNDVEHFFICLLAICTFLLRIICSVDFPFIQWVVIL